MANTYYLKPDTGSDGNSGLSIGSPWQTLTKLRTSLVAGDIVNVLAGTYTPAQYRGAAAPIGWTQTDSKGQANNPITIQANPGDTVIFDGQFENYWINFYTTATYAGHYIIIKNLIFHHFGGVALNFGGINAPGHHFAVQGCTFQNFSMVSSGAVGTGGSPGGGKAQYVIVKDCTFRNIGDPTLGGGGDGFPNSQHAIYISDFSEYIVLTGNYIETISGYGLHNWNDHGPANTGLNYIERYNTIVNCHSSDIIIAGETYQNIYIYNNTLYQEAIPFPTIDSANAARGITFNNSATAYNHIRIFNNIIYGFYSEAAFTQNDSTVFTDLQCDYNNWTNRNDINRTFKWDATISGLATFQAGSGQDLHSIVGNPQFIDRDARNFNLVISPVSPAINVGRALTTVVGSGSGVTVTLADAGFFCDGFGLITGDSVKIGSNNLVTITSVNYSTNVVTLSESITFTNGNSVSLAYSGVVSDMGAYESAVGSVPDIPSTHMTMTPQLMVMVAV